MILVREVNRTLNTELVAVVQQISGLEVTILIKSSSICDFELWDFKLT